MCLVVWHVVCTVYSGGVGARPKKQLTVRQGGRNVSFQTTLQSLLTAPCFSRNGRHWHSKHLRNQTTSGKAPETCLPACLRQPLLNCRSKYAALIGMACSCYSEGGSSATPLMSTTVSKAGEPFSLFCFPFRPEIFLFWKVIFEVKQTKGRFTCF